MTVWPDGKNALRQDPFTATVVGFRARKADRLKLLYRDGTGLVIACKRLVEHSFTRSAVKDGLMLMKPGLRLRRLSALHRHGRQPTTGLHAGRHGTPFRIQPPHRHQKAQPPAAIDDAQAQVGAAFHSLGVMRSPGFMSAKPTSTVVEFDRKRAASTVITRSGAVQMARTGTPIPCLPADHTVRTAMECPAKIVAMAVAETVMMTLSVCGMDARHDAHHNLQSLGDWQDRNLGHDVAAPPVRVGDAFRMRRDHVDGDSIKVQQGKTGARHWVRLPPLLRTIRAARPKPDRIMAAQRLPWLHGLQPKTCGRCVAIG